MRNQIDDLSQLALLLADPFFCLLAILDVDTRSIPFDNSAALVAHGHLLVEHPAILPVRPPHAPFEYKGLAAHETGPPPRDERGHVVFVDRRRPLPALEVLQAQADKLEPALVEEIQVPVGTTRVDQCGKGIDKPL